MFTGRNGRGVHSGPQEGAEIATVPTLAMGNDFLLAATR